MTPEETRVYGRTLAAIAHRLDGLTDNELEHLRRVPVRRALDAFDAYPAPRDYDFISLDIEAIDAEVRLDGEDEWARTYWQLVAWHLVARSLQCPRDLVLPPVIVEIELANFERIINAAPEAVTSDPLGDNAFLEDLALARRAAVSFDKLLGVPMTIEEEGEGFTPGTWMFAHLSAEEYGPDALAEILPTVFAFFRANPILQGCFGAGWLVDPALAEVSPHLAWYRESLAAMGAEFFVSENGPATTDLATRTSNTRRALVEAGKYRPQNYMWRLSRDALMQLDDASS